MNSLLPLAACMSYPGGNVISSKHVGDTAFYSCITVGELARLVYYIVCT